MGQRPVTIFLKILEKKGNAPFSIKCKGERKKALGQGALRQRNTVQGLTSVYIVFILFKEKILSGELKTGEALPSIRLLAKELRISVITTKRAYDDLEKEGFIHTMPGKGSFVAPRNPELYREQALKQVEDLLGQAVEAARKGGVSRDEVQEILTLLYEEN